VTGGTGPPPGVFPPGPWPDQAKLSRARTVTQDTVFAFVTDIGCPRAQFIPPFHGVRVKHSAKAPPNGVAKREGPVRKPRRGGHQSFRSDDRPLNNACSSTTPRNASPPPSTWVSPASASPRQINSYPSSANMGSTSKRLLSLAEADVTTGPHARPHPSSPPEPARHTKSYEHHASILLPGLDTLSHLVSSPPGSCRLVPGSNQGQKILRPVSHLGNWPLTCDFLSGRRDSNPRPLDPQSDNDCVTPAWLVLFPPSSRTEQHENDRVVISRAGPFGPIR
jgi:hypothetical protein